MGGAWGGRINRGPVCVGGSRVFCVEGRGLSAGEIGGEARSFFGGISSDWGNRGRSLFFLRGRFG